ncbi:MAG TPA: hypothetical protein VKG91_18090 [Roseiarcus sp.]|nr:hypothetical protein [Roseiarcus sp.]
MASKSATQEELQSLREELSTAGRARQPKSAPSPATAEPRAEDLKRATGPAAAAAPDGATDSETLRDEISELMSEAVRFLEERESDMGAHPVAIAIGGIVVGLIIGRMLGRR